MNREVHVRFSEGLAVRFRGATQLVRIFQVGRVAGGWTPIGAAALGHASPTVEKNCRLVFPPSGGSEALHF